MWKNGCCGRRSGFGAGDLEVRGEMGLKAGDCEQGKEGVVSCGRLGVWDGCCDSMRGMENWGRGRMIGC